MSCKEHCRDVVAIGQQASPTGKDDALSRHPGWVVAGVVTRLRNRAGSTDGEAGMTTAEYAVGTVAACGFSGILYKVVTSPQVLDVLKDVILKAFKLSF